MISILSALLLMSGILAIILTRPSHSPAHIDETTGSPVLVFGLGQRILAVIIGLQAPISIYFIVYPLFLYHEVFFVFFLLYSASSLSSGFAMFVNSLRYKIELTQDNIVEGRVFLRPRMVPWKNVRRVSYSNRILRIRSLDGATIRVKSWMTGFPTLLNEMKTKAPPHFTKRVIEQMKRLGFTP